MRQNLKGLVVAVLGGDARELVLVEYLLQLGAEVRVVGLPVSTKAAAGVKAFSDIKECVAGADAVILPVPGINDQGKLHCAFSERSLFLTEEMLAAVSENTPVFVGTARPVLAEMLASRGLRLIELMKLDEVAILNSIPSAEGAIQMAMEMLPITIHGSSAFVLGFGRTGMTLARSLNALGARTKVVARNPAQLARAFEMGLQPITFEEMPQYLREADVIFNTVPARILTRGILSAVPQQAVIIDLASSPGGTDFQAASELGIRAVLAPGLPGKVAPKTAGLILGRVITRMLV